MTKNTLIMYVVDNHVRCLDKYLYCHVRCCQSCTKQCQTKSDKSCPSCCFLTFFTFFQHREGPLQCSENVKKQQKGPVWISLSQTTTIIMYVSFYNHVRREDKHQCYHVRCWPSCTLFGQISVLSCTLLSVMYAMSNKIRLKSAPLLLFYVFMFSQCSKGPLQCSKNVKKGSKRLRFESD